MGKEIVSFPPSLADEILTGLKAVVNLQATDCEYSQGCETELNFYYVPFWTQIRTGRGMQKVHLNEQHSSREFQFAANFEYFKINIPLHCRGDYIS